MGFLDELVKRGQQVGGDVIDAARNHWTEPTYEERVMQDKFRTQMMLMLMNLPKENPSVPIFRPDAVLDPSQVRYTPVQLPQYLDQIGRFMDTRVHGPAGWNPRQTRF